MSRRQKMLKIANRSSKVDKEPFLESAGRFFHWQVTLSLEMVKITAVPENETLIIGLRRVN